MSEQLLHRFMEVILVVFSIICNSRDEYRSTASRVNSTINVGKVSCTIWDDGYVYMSRSGTTQASDRSRYGKKPIIRYEVTIPFIRVIFQQSLTRGLQAKRLAHSQTADSDVTAQIFSELLSAAVENMKYLEDTDPSATDVHLPGEIPVEADYTYKRDIDLAPYHDAFVISMSHYELSIHTARFPTPYLRWVTERDRGDNCKERFCILHKMSQIYDLSLPEKRLEAAQDILILLWAIRHGGFKDSTSGIFVAGALMKQTILKAETEKDATTSNDDAIDEEQTKQESNQHGKQGQSTVVTEILDSVDQSQRKVNNHFTRLFEESKEEAREYQDERKAEVAQEAAGRKKEVVQTQDEFNKQANEFKAIYESINNRPRINTQNPYDGQYPKGGYRDYAES
ncbi:hypothetical protein NW768_011695 [Fusarium equiseti]|uniref:Uncharacterized protein n=1 Tax=Fusarium equiseti TaxID=61235 RepID=A0ABQ8QW64_FUSEQ|nr:hypothetical protein NW768_011695 [Fusarium equiseti]